MLVRWGGVNLTVHSGLWVDIYVMTILKTATNKEQSRKELYSIKRCDDLK